MAKFNVIFEPLCGNQVKPLWVDAEHSEDIDVQSLGDNIDPSGYNSADWHIRDAFGITVRCAPIS